MTAKDRYSPGTGATSRPKEDTLRHVRKASKIAARSRFAFALAAVSIAATTLTCFVPATAAGSVALSVQSFTDPSRMSPGDETTCNRQGRCDRYQLVIHNVGDTPSDGPIEVIDKLPPGITTTGQTEESQEVGGKFDFGSESAWQCTAPSEPTEQVGIVRCSYPAQVNPEQYAPVLRIPTTAPPAGSPAVQDGACVQDGKTHTPGDCVEHNEVTVSGGGAGGESIVSSDTTVSAEPEPFELTGFQAAATNASGATDIQAGGHPNDLTVDFGIANKFQPAGILGEIDTQTEPIENVKTIVVELPAGFLGDVQAASYCPEYDLVKTSVGPEAEKSACPSGSRVGVVGFSAEGDVSSSTESSGPSAIYNIAPEAGYPAEFAFAFAEKVIYMYATVVHGSSGYRIRVTAPAVPAGVGLVGASLSFFGDPALTDGGPSAGTAFLTNPADCSSAELSDGLLKTKIEANSWENPGRWVSAEAETYPQISGCDLLRFAPTLEAVQSPASEGGTVQADEPSGYRFDLQVPQAEAFDELATPQLKNATVTLPAGVSVSPAAAAGLSGCEKSGLNGIDIPESPSGHEAGAGEAIGADGLPHMTPGHCPAASTLGTVEIFTPLLPNGADGSAPLKGHVYLAQPRCGGPDQPECTEASAANGELFGLYIEAQGSGVIVKLPGTVAANPQTGQLTATFAENPQLPFSDLVLHLDGGPRAPLANPQTCGEFTTVSSLEPWSVPQTPDAVSSSSFEVTGCDAPTFAPAFTAGTVAPSAGAFSPFTLTFSRQDREQDLSGLSVTLPPGLLGAIRGIPLCGEAQANSGTCGPGSEIGTTSVAAGSGEDPYSIPGGRVFLTTGYKGQPFGLSIVVPAAAGPFDLGDVVVRASIHVDPSTSAITVTSDPLPQSKDGVPFRLRAVHVTIDRPRFTFNPTNCAQQQVMARIVGAQGASVDVSSPFAAAGCVTLPFKPALTASTRATRSKAGGASLVVRIAQKAGEANIHKVDLQLPTALPARLTTLQKACTEAQFNANPAGCPAGSNIGTATAVTPVLDAPLTGPAYLVSHGGAAFPDVVFVLQGQGVQIDLDGKTDIKKGITYSRFETVPDAPISSFETDLPEGPHSALAANGNLCNPTKTVSVRKRVTVRVRGRVRRATKVVRQTVSQPLSMPTTITGQNGVTIRQSTKIAVTKCPKPKTKKTKKRSKQERRKGAKKT
jgi:hypothetical protein